MKYLKTFEAHSIGIANLAPVHIFLYYYICHKCNNTFANIDKLISCPECNNKLTEVTKKEFFNFLYSRADTPQKKDNIDRMKDQIESDIIPLEALPHEDDNYDYED